MFGDTPSYNPRDAHLLGASPTGADPDQVYAVCKLRIHAFFSVLTAECGNPGFMANECFLGLAANKLNEPTPPLNLRLYVKIQGPLLTCRFGYPLAKNRVISDAVWESFFFVSFGEGHPAASSKIAHNSSDVNKSLKGVRARERKDNYSRRGELL